MSLGSLLEKQSPTPNLLNQNPHFKQDPQEILMQITSKVVTLTKDVGCSHWYLQRKDNREVFNREKGLSPK